jgi:phosphoglycolate phosphatase
MGRGPINAVVFDFDGTLVNSDPVKRSSFYDATVNVPGAWTALDTILGNPDAGDRYRVYAMLAAHLNAGSEQADNWATEYGKLCEHRILDLLDRSCVARFLLRLKSEGYLLFIASATPQTDLTVLIEKSSLASIFTSIFGRPMSKIESLREIMTHYAWSPDQIVVVGNGESDRHAAVTAECRFIGVGPDSTAFNQPVGIIAKNMNDIGCQIERLSLV